MPNSWHRRHPHLNPITTWNFCQFSSKLDRYVSTNFQKPLFMNSGKIFRAINNFLSSVPTISAGFPLPSCLGCVLLWNLWHLVFDVQQHQTVFDDSFPTPSPPPLHIPKGASLFYFAAGLMSTDRLWKILAAKRSITAENIFVLPHSRRAAELSSPHTHPPLCLCLYINTHDHTTL